MVWLKIAKGVDKEKEAEHYYIISTEISKCKQELVSDNPRELGSQGLVMTYGESSQTQISPFGCAKSEFCFPLSMICFIFLI